MFLEIVLFYHFKDFVLHSIVKKTYTISDMVLCSLWVALATFGIGLQCYKQRGKPPFPPPPYLRYRERSRERSLLQRFFPTERTPLLTDTDPSAPGEPPPYTPRNYTAESPLPSHLYLSV